MIRVALGAAIAAAMMSSAVMAADLIVDEPIADVAVAGYDWNGFYVGGQIGAVFGNGDTDIPAYLDPNFDVPVTGWLGGLHIGVNAQMDSMVFGVEAAANWVSASGSELSGGGPVGELYEIDQTWEASLVGRAGFAADQFLLYGLAGVTGTSLTTNYDPAAFPDSTDTVWGWTVGVGAEVAFTEEVSARAEYRYADYGTADFMHGGPSTVDYTSHTITTGLSFHF